MSATTAPLVGVIMGSSDWETLRHSRHPQRTGYPHEVEAVSAHRTDKLFAYAATAAERVLVSSLPVPVVLRICQALRHQNRAAGVGCAGAIQNTEWCGFAAVHRANAGRRASWHHGTIGKAGAVNAALLACAMLGNHYPEYRAAYERYRQQQTDKVLSHPDPRNPA